MSELRQSPEHADFMRSIGWHVEQSPKRVVAYVRGILPFVSVMKIQRASILDIDWEWVKKIAKKHKVWGCYVEPLESELSCDDKLHEIWSMLKKKLRMTETKNAMLPTATRQIDLTHSEQKLLKEMKEKTRYNVGLAKRRGLRAGIVSGKRVVASERLFERVADMIEVNARRAGYWAIPRKWLKAQLKAFDTNGEIIIVADEKSIEDLENDKAQINFKSWQAVACYWLSDDGIFYGANGSTAMGRKNMAPTLAVWEGMRLGKRRKKRYFDFDGIYDERVPNKRWLGYSVFKAGFGGYEVKYKFSGFSWFPCW